MRQPMKLTKSVLLRLYGEDAPAPKPEPKPEPTPAPEPEQDYKKAYEAEMQKRQELQETLEHYNKQVADGSATEESLKATISSLNAKLKTEKQLAEEAKNKERREAEQKINNLGEELDSWKSRFNTTVMEKEISEAAVANKAINPSQILAILSNSSKVEEMKDDEGNGTGQFQTISRINVKKEDGTQESVELPVAKAIERLKEQETYFNLFSDKSKFGPGSSTTSGSDNTYSADEIRRMIRNDPRKYRELRDAGKIKTKK